VQHPVDPEELHPRRQEPQVDQVLVDRRGELLDDLDLPGGDVVELDGGVDRRDGGPAAGARRRL